MWITYILHSISQSHAVPVIAWCPPEGLEGRGGGGGGGVGGGGGGGDGPQAVLQCGRIIPD